MERLRGEDLETRLQVGPLPLDRANTFNEEGKDELYANHFDKAARKFQDAAARVPDPKCFLNLGVALFQMGHFDEAQTALHAVLESSPPEALARKAKKLLDRIAQEARRQGSRCIRRDRVRDSRRHAGRSRQKIVW